MSGETKREEQRVCPYCCELIRKGATVCPHCRKPLGWWDEVGIHVFVVLVMTALCLSYLFIPSFRVAVNNVWRKVCALIFWLIH